MALLDRILEAEQPAYRSAADRQPAAAEDVRRGSRGLRLLTGAVCVVIGLTLATGARDLAVGDPATRAHHQRLVGEVQDARALRDVQETRAAELRSDVEHLRAQGPAAADRSLDAALSAAAGQAALQDVTGPGVTVLLDDREANAGAVPTSRVGTGLPPERVQPEDLAQVVNALWAAGAEAVSVNGIRLTSLSTIRFAGEALLVGFTALTRPYSVNAIGEPEMLFRAVSSGSVEALRTTLAGYGVKVDVSTHDDVTVPRGQSGELWAVEPVQTDQTTPQPERSAP